MIVAKVGKYSFELERQGENWLVNGEATLADGLEGQDGFYHILYNNKGYRVEIVSVERQGKMARIKVNGRMHEVTLQDKTDLLLEKMGMAELQSQKINDLKAPMPGLIVDIKVKEGDTVVKGDALLVLEAMKMENTIKSAGEGEIKGISVNIGDGVEKGQVLISFA